MRVVMSKYCECGCGGLAPICTMTSKKRGLVKGEPFRFILGHNSRGKNNPNYGKHSSEYTKQKISKNHVGMKGKRHSLETRHKMSEAHKGKRIGEKHPLYGKHHSLETRKKIGKAKWKGGHKAFKERQKNDLKWCLNNRISSGIRESLKNGSKNGRYWESLVGYSVEQLKKHLQKTIPEKYSWADFLSGDLHIDHRIPISVYNFDCPENLDFKKCWDLNNLQLLPAKENLSKGNKINIAFQPSLRL